jgi:hypothetical protein
MKTWNFVSLLLISVSSVNCETLNLVRPSCKDSKIVSEVFDRIGTIQFDQGRGYSVSYHVPNTIDSIITGVFCNLPEEFKKAGLIIRYSGRYKEREKDNLLLFGGQEIYTLELIDIKLH